MGALALLQADFAGQNGRGFPWKVLESFGKFWKVLESSGKFWKVCRFGDLHRPRKSLIYLDFCMKKTNQKKSKLIKTNQS